MFDPRDGGGGNRDFYLGRRGSSPTPERRESMDNSSRLLVNSLNYHGQQLTSFLRDTSLAKNIDMKRVDYHAYQQRSKTMKLEDRGKRLLLHRFISQKGEGLFEPDTELGQRMSLGNGNIEDHAALMPPLEVFNNVDPALRTKLLLKAIKVGDVILCEVHQKAPSGILLNMLAFDSVTEKSRYVVDLKVLGFCPTAEMVAAGGDDDLRDVNAGYQIGDIVRVALLEVKPDQEKFLAGMRNSALPSDLQNIIKLGLASRTDLPVTLRYTKQALDHGYTYEDFLLKSPGFINPNNVAHLCSELGISNNSTSFMEDLNGKYKEEMYAPQLRIAQNKQWAAKHVHLGIKNFKSGNKIEAFQSLNQALNIDPKNVEGLVARGALYANNSGLAKAIEDFEAALKADPNHANGKKYMCETLVAVARNQEDDKEIEKAIETYKRILSYIPDHKEARESIIFLRGGPSPGQTQLDQDIHHKLPRQSPERSPYAARNRSPDGHPHQEPHTPPSQQHSHDRHQQQQGHQSQHEILTPTKHVYLNDRARSQDSNSVMIEQQRSFDGGLPLHQVPGASHDVREGSISYIPHHDDHDRSRVSLTDDRLSAGRDDHRSSISMSDMPVNIHEPPPMFAAPIPNLLGGPPPVQHVFRDKEEESDYNAKVEMFLRQTNSAPSYRHQDSYRRSDRDREHSIRHSGDHRSRHSGEYRSSRSSRYESSSRRRSSSRDRKDRDRHSSRDYRGRDRYSSSSRSHTEYRTESGKSRDPYRDSETGKSRDPIRELDKSVDHRESSSSRNKESQRSRSREKMEPTREMSKPEVSTRAEEPPEETRTVTEHQQEQREIREVSSPPDVLLESERKVSRGEKNSLTPLLELLKDDHQLRQKLADHLAIGKDKDKEEKKKKKKKDKDKEKSDSRSRSPKKKKDKKKKKIKNEDGAGEEFVISSDDDNKKSKKKKVQDKESLYEEFIEKKKLKSGEVPEKHSVLDSFFITSKGKGAPPIIPIVPQPKQVSPSRSKSRSRDRKRSRSRDRKKSRSRDKRRSRSRDKERSRSRDKRRSRSRDKRRSRSRDKERSRSREKKRSRSRDKKRSRSRERKRSRSRDKHRRSRSRDRKRSRSRDKYREKSRTPEKPVKQEDLFIPPAKQQAFTNAPKNSIEMTPVNQINIPKDSSSGKGLWIPVGEDSIRESIKMAVNRMGTPIQPKFDPHKKISLSTDAPANSKDFDVTYDAKIGMYIRVPRHQATPAPPTMAEKVANSRKSRMDREQDRSSDVVLTEERTIRAVATPEKSGRSRSRSKSSRRKRSRSRSRSRKRSRSRSRSTKRSRRSRSRSRSRSRERSHHHKKSSHYSSSSSQHHSARDRFVHQDYKGHQDDWSHKSMKEEGGDKRNGGGDSKSGFMKPDD